MRPIFYVSLFAFLAVTPATVLSKKAGFLFDSSDFANEVLDLLGRVKDANSHSGLNHDSSGNKRLHKLLSRQIVTLSEDMDGKFDEVFEKMEKLPKEFIFLMDRNTLLRDYQMIQSITEEQVLAQMRMNKNKRKVPDRRLNLKDTWEKIRSLINEKKFFTKLTTNWHDYYDKQWEGVCRTNMSTSQVINILVGQYLNIAKQYFLARRIDLNIRIRDQKINGGHNSFDGDDEDLYSDIQSQVNEDLDYFKSIMNEAPRDFWTCDREIDSQSPWFVELKAFTKYFTVKKNIPVSCESGCANFTITECKSDYDYGLCSDLRFCPNEFISCQPHQSVQTINFCSNNCDTETYRRYAFITHGSFGERRCNHTIRNNEVLFDPITNQGRTVSSRTRRDGAYFECICPEEQYVINTHPVTADPGHVIIGARLAVLDKTIVIIAVQGQLDEAGYVRNHTYKRPPVKNSKWKTNHEVLNWNDEIDLTPTTVPENHVVTGFRFRKDGKRFYLQLQSRELDSDYRLGSKKRWNEKVNLGTDEYSFGPSADRPDNSTTKHNQHSKANQFVKFNVTGLYEDGGQTTIPFIDTQLVRPFPLTPLSGMSLYVRGQEGFGGFLGIKLQTMNLIPYLSRNKDVKDHVGDIQRYLSTL